MTLIERIYKNVVRPRVFEMSKDDAEIAHEWGIGQMKRLQKSRLGLAAARSLFTYNHPVLRTNVLGLDFPNPLGLAAGFDKYCEVYHTAVPALGWGFVEVGGITPLPQEGNPRPRMWRSARDAAICNAMGFNNPGALQASYRISAAPACPIPLIVNVGKGRDTPLEKADQDYVDVVSELWPLADAFTINVSSPNTQKLRELQGVNFLVPLLERVQALNRSRLASFGKGEQPRKIGIKISPDEPDEVMADVVYAARRCRVDYLIAVNTTMTRPFAIPDFPSDRGGVSGKPLAERAMKVLRQLAIELKGEIPIISVGGIGSAYELYQRILQGASLCQAYTAWPFEGPDFVKRTLGDLTTMLTLDGYANVSHAVGAEL